MLACRHYVLKHITHEHKLNDIISKELYRHFENTGLKVVMLIELRYIFNITNTQHFVIIN
jgi:hypothetical protein